MPELPEVETIRGQLEKEIVGEEIAEVWYDAAKMLKPSPEEFVAGVRGQKVTGVGRRAKLLIFNLSGGNSFVAHLRMSGQLLIRQQSASADDYIHVRFKLASGRELRFAEPRLFGYAQFLAGPGELAAVLAKYGPEPLDDLDFPTFYQALQGTKRAVKAALLDQHLFSGIGNIYANDALWLAKIHPQRPAASLSKEEVATLLAAIEDVLREGLATKGASDQWYRDAYGKRGSYQEHFKVYGRTGQPCNECETPVERIVVGGRGTFLCPRCQPRLVSHRPRLVS